MAEDGKTNHGAPGGIRRYSEPVPIGAIVPDVCARIQARCQRATRRLRLQRQEPGRTVRRAG